jgi:hypothetical protein
MPEDRAFSTACCPFNLFILFPEIGVLKFLIEEDSYDRYPITTYQAV